MTDLNTEMLASDLARELCKELNDGIDGDDIDTAQDRADFIKDQTMEMLDKRGLLRDLEARQTDPDDLIQDIQAHIGFQSGRFVTTNEERMQRDGDKLLEAMKDILKAHDLKMGPKALRLRLNIARDIVKSLEGR